MQWAEPMIQSAPMKQSLRYDQISCRLQLDGLPDVSAGQSSEAIGILTRWSLEWLGRPQLEGRREHLEALMAAVLPYARHLISGVDRPFGDPEAPVSIEPAGDGEGRHRLRLRSSQPGVEPLQLDLEDAELADLVRVLDQMRLDPRLQLPLPLPPPRPLRHRELSRRTPLARRLAAPLGGALALGLAAGVAALLPLPPLPAPDEGGRRVNLNRPAPPPVR
jgi:hypothetical protein